MSRRVLRPFAKPLLVASVVIGLAAVIVAFAVIPGKGGRSFTVTAEFEDTAGLYEGNSVSVLGMRIGKVTSIVPKDTRIEVKFEIDSGIDLPADVQAVTVSTSILTDRHIELTPPYRDGPKLKSGDVLGLSRTRTPVEFDRTLAMADRLSRSLNGDGQGQGPVADLVRIGAQIATKNGPDIKAALDQLSQALRLSADSGSATKEDIQGITASLAELMQAAADNNTAIKEFGSDIRMLSDIVSAENLGAGNTGAQINQILDQAGSLLEKNRDGLKATIGNFDTLMTGVTDRKRELAEIIDLLPLLATNIYNAVDPSGRALRVHVLLDKLLLDSQMTKEMCNLAAIKDLGCATGTYSDYTPEFGARFFGESMVGMLENMAGVPR